MKPILCLFLSFFSVFYIKAQTSDIDYYFDDGGISTSKNNLKINLLTPVNGAYSLSCEHFFTRKLAIEMGATYLASYYIPEISNLKGLGSADMDFQTIGGVGYIFQPKLYHQLYQSHQLQRYFSVLFRQRFYQLIENQQRTHTDMGLVVGLYQDFGSRITLDYSTGFAYRTYSYSYAMDSNDIKSNFIGILTVKIGIKI